MLKRIPIYAGWLCAATSLAAAPLAAQTSIKIGVADMDYVVAQSSAGKGLMSRIEEFQGQAETEVKRMLEQASGIRQRIADSGDSLSADQLSELQKEYEDAQIALRRLRDDKQREVQKLQTEGMAEIERRLEPVFKAMRDEDGYDLILNYVPGVVVMTSDRVNITAMVLERFNRELAKEGP